MTAQPTTLASMRNPVTAPAPDVVMGFGNLQSFELMQRAANLLSNSTLVPVAYRAFIEKTDRYGNVTERRENPNALANAVVALNMSQRMGADPLMIMQNLFVIEGRPSWSSTFIIAAINSCGKFSPLRFTLVDLGEKEVERVEVFWENKQRQTRTVKVKIADRMCTAWALEKETGERLESPPVTMEMAVQEGWYTKNGSKWVTMPDVMLRYRTASFFGRLYAPELLMGLKTVEEMGDIIEVNPATGEVLNVTTTEALRGDMRMVDPGPVVDKELERAAEQPPATAAPPVPAETEKPSQPEAPPAPESDPGQAATEGPSDRVKIFMKEINTASAGGSIAVDTWRAKHHGRVAKTCGGVETADYKQVMDYAEILYRELVESETAGQA